MIRNHHFIVAKDLDLDSDVIPMIFGWVPEHIIFLFISKMGIYLVYS